MRIPKNLAVATIIASMILGTLSPAVQAVPSFVSIEVRDARDLDAEGPVGTFVEIFGSARDANNVGQPGIVVHICYLRTDIMRPTYPACTTDPDTLFIIAVTDSNGDYRITPDPAIPQSVAGTHQVLAVLKDFSQHQAAEPFTVISKIELGTTQGAVDDPVAISGTGFAGNRPITVDFDITRMNCLPPSPQLPPVRTDKFGSFSGTCAVPERDFAVPNGRAIIEASDSQNSDDNEFFLVPSVTVEPNKGPVGVGVNTDVGTALTIPDPAVTLSVMARGFVRNADVTVFFDRAGNFQRSVTGRTNALGTFQFTFPTPEIPQKPGRVPYVFDANQTVILSPGPPPVILIIGGPSANVEARPDVFTPTPDIDLNPDHGRSTGVPARPLEIAATGTGFASNVSVDIELRRWVAPPNQCSGAFVLRLRPPETTRNTGSFFTSFSTPEISANLYQVLARDGSGNTACADFVIGIFLRVRQGTPNEGKVGDTVTVEGFAFTGGQVSLRMVPSDVSDRGCDTIATRFTPDRNGDFSGQFTVPNCNRGDYNIVAEDAGGGRATTSYQVFPWIIIGPMTGVVGSTVTVDGTGWARNVDVAVIYFGADATIDQLGTRAPQGFNAANSRTIWSGSIPQSGITGVLNANGLAGFWRIETIGSEKSFTTRSGSFGEFRMTFTAPESWGGYHPVYGREVQSRVECGPDGGGPVVSEQILCGQAFRLKPTVEVTPPEAKAGQRNLMLEGSGLSWWDHYAQKTTAGGSFAETNKVYRLRFDFVQADGTRFQGYIDEARHIYNGLRDSSWDMGAYAPVALNAQGMIVYWDYRLEDRTGSVPPGGSLGQMGSPFLQAPNLQPGPYSLRAYRQTLSSPPQPDLSESADAVLAIRSAELDDIKAHERNELDRFGQLRTHVNAEVNRIRDELTTFVNNNLKPFLTGEVNRVRDEVRTQVTSETNRIRDEVKTFTTQEANRVRDDVKTQVTSETNRVRDELKTFTTQEANRVRDDVKTQVTSETNRVRDELKSFTTQEANRIRDAMTPAVNEARQNTADLKASIPLTLQTSPLGYVIAILAAIAALGSIAAAIITSRRLKVAG